MNQPSNEYIEQVKKMYLFTKNVLQKVSDGDNHSQEAQTLRRITSMKQLEEFREFVKGLEDHGVHLLFN